MDAQQELFSTLLVQLKEEFKEVLDLTNYVMDTLGIRDDITYRFSKWDPTDTDKYINNPEAWNETQSI